MEFFYSSTSHYPQAVIPLCNEDKVSYTVGLTPTHPCLFSLNFILCFKVKMSRVWVVYSKHDEKITENKICYAGVIV